MTRGFSKFASKAVVLVIAGLLPAWASAQQAAPTPPPGRTASGGITQDRMDELAHKHPKYLGALAPENLNKKRPKAPFDLTGTWFVDLRRAYADFRFGPPYPEFYEPGQTALREADEARKKGVSYRDASGQCYPIGMPMIMTRVWPTSMIQKPTIIYMLFAFTNSMRFIYLDGRPHSDPDYSVPTYNGESIGRWEGDTLVVHSKYFETNEHYIDSGIPISDEFEMVERIKLLDKGMTLHIDYTMTDPKMWKGEWKSSKNFIRQDYSDIPEVECLPNLNQNLPSTGAGQKAVDDRAKAAK